MNEYLIYTGEGYTQNPDGDDVENFQILGIGCPGENGRDAIAALGEELAGGDPDSESDAAVMGFDMREAKAVQTLTPKQREAIRLFVEVSDGAQPTSAADVAEALAILREMVKGFTPSPAEL